MRDYPMRFREDLRCIDVSDCQDLVLLGQKRVLDLSFNHGRTDLGLKLVYFRAVGLKAEELILLRSDTKLDIKKTHASAKLSPK
jgi:hypothetical protein